SRRSHAHASGFHEEQSHDTPRKPARKFAGTFYGSGRRDSKVWRRSNAAGGKTAAMTPAQGPSVDMTNTLSRCL
ncbi:MAG: hypothetical protein ACREHD_21165, partial [Pirellulales bacterium]